MSDDRAGGPPEHERPSEGREPDDAPIDDAGAPAGAAAPTAPETPDDGEYPSRSRVFLAGLRASATVCLQALIVLAFLWVLIWVVGKFWTIVLPVVLAIIVATVLWPPVRFMLRFGVPAALASLLSLLGLAAIIAGILAVVVPSVIDQVPELRDRTIEGVKHVQEWVQGPPLSVDDSQLSGYVETIIQRVQSSALAIASGVYTGVGAATSVLMTGFTAFVLVFFFLKDGPKFIPWLNRTAGSSAGSHIAEVLVRMWNTLGGFIRTQAIVSAVDAVLIGIGLYVLNVPLWGVLTIVTFVGGFIPILGAFVAGALAVLIALVANSLTTALIVFGIILLVQQLEGNVLQPWLQAKAMELHAAIVLLAVLLGGSLFGIIGAFLAVPTTACLTVLLRYVLEQIGRAAGEQIQEEDEASGDDSGPGEKRSLFAWRRSDGRGEPSAE
ncbi:MAG: AI-2E family transporter [Gordonia sp. (in: high G+C Gram-positive bacteria)]|uniref:AI-2E family transporter n=1 Tax=Gordonia sp. (in: high G+C Gram-positive bacteria) TaxID=84139 RepID=UPI0039E31D65